MEGLTMTTTENTKNSTISFRNKFEKLIKCDYEHQVFEESFEKFFALNPEEALDMLWKLTYAPAINILEKIGLYAGISDEMFIALRNELRHQYKEVHPDFLKMSIPEDCQEAFDVLKNKSDIITAAVVYAHCQSCLYLENMDRILFLLNSDKENNYFGGIRSLFFNADESAYLKQFHEQIYDLLMALHNNVEQHNNSCKNMPFEGLDKLLENADKVLPFYVDVSAQKDVDETLRPVMGDEPLIEPEVKQPVATGSAYKSLTAEEIMANKDAFASLVKDADLNILVQIGQLGFDLNKVMDKKEAISNLLKAIESMEKAEAKVLAAAKSKEKAEVKLFKAAEALSK